MTKTFEDTALKNWNYKDEKLTTWDLRLNKEVYVEHVLGDFYYFHF